MESIHISKMKIKLLICFRPISYPVSLGCKAKAVQVPNCKLSAPSAMQFHNAPNQPSLFSCRFLR